MAYTYTSFGSYLDHAEPFVVIDSWRLAQGGQLFLPITSEEYTVTAYGPLIYIIHASYMMVAGATISVSKIPSAWAAFAAVVVLGVFILRRHGVQRLPFGIFIAITFLMIAGFMSFWTRPDPYLILLVAIALCSTSFDQKLGYSSWVAPVVIAVCAGLAFNLKIHAPLYFVPLVFRYCLDRWFVRWPVMAGFFFIHTRFDTHRSVFPRRDTQPGSCLLAPRACRNRVNIELSCLSAMYCGATAN